MRLKAIYTLKKDNPFAPNMTMFLPVMQKIETKELPEDYDKETALKQAIEATPKGYEFLSIVKIAEDGTDQHWLHYN